jgi:hypothetical protein
MPLTAIFDVPASPADDQMGQASLALKKPDPFAASICCLLKHHEIGPEFYLNGTGHLFSVQTPFQRHYRFGKSLYVIVGTTK